MTTKKNETHVEESSPEAAEGARKLRLTVVRMKKIRSNVRGGVNTEIAQPDGSTGNSW